MPTPLSQLVPLSALSSDRKSHHNPPYEIYLLTYSSGGNQFTKIADGNCMVPQGLQGEVYMMITKSESVADAEVLAGPSVIQPS